jgi:WD40 repeat protein
VFFYLYASDMILQSGNQPAVLVWDCSTMSFVSELKGHLYGVECIAFSPNG